MSAPFEVTAVRYGTLSTTRAELFYRYSLYEEPDGPIEMDYFFWVVRSAHTIRLVDCGFHPDAGRRRGRTLLIDPVDALADLGIKPGDVTEIIVSHAHYDHIGNLASFPAATVVIQRRELEFWTGPKARRPQFAAVSETDELAHLSELAHGDALRVVDGDTVLEPGIELQLVGGHTSGQQIVKITTSSGMVVLATDALHLYEELERDMPFGIFADLSATYDAFEILRELEAAGATIVAGHDPLVMERYSGDSPTYAVITKTTSDRH